MAGDFRRLVLDEYNRREGYMQVTKRAGFNAKKHITSLVDLSGLGLLCPCSL